MAGIKTVSEEYQELYHYTTAVGLQGILQSRVLWATHMGYLNDPEEHSGFFKRRLPKLLDAPCREAIGELMQTPDGRKAIESAEIGGPERAIMDFKRDLSALVHKVAFNINEPYIVSFCKDKAHRTPNDGLLSQWRGYGTDGGYAVVFDAAGLEKLLHRENDAFEYQFGNFCDVDYDFPEGSDRPVHPEREKWEADLHRAFKEFILSRGKKALHMHMEISALSSRYKHYGFSEEEEVRIVVIPVHDEVRALSVEIAAKAGHTLRPRKPVKFRERRGVLIPYLELFAQGILGVDEKLPVSRILVGPHPDRGKRAESLRGMVKQCGMTVPVVESGIPYLGR